MSAEDLLSQTDGVSDNGWDGYYDVSDAECGWCGEVKPCRYVPDPFIDEVYPEDKPAPEPWCADCYDRRHDEV